MATSQLQLATHQLGMGVGMFAQRSARQLQDRPARERDAMR